MDAGLYIHVPFCRKRCPFCDFAITTDLSMVEGWKRALLREMALRSGEWPEPFDTVYLGGGTPSLLRPEAVEEVLAAARSRFRIAGDAEVTLEANPGTLGAGDFGRLARAGVNRLSLGVQSFDEEALRLLGRDHTVRESLDSFRMARGEGFGNISIDLIYGLPGRSSAWWGEQLERGAALGPEHLSAYQLTYEPGTDLTRRKERGEIGEPTQEEARELFLLTRDRLQRAAYRQYEVSSFARSPGHESRHNRKYWEGAPYLGLGPSAHSYRDGTRSWNTPRAKGYLEALESGRDPRAGQEVLSREEKKLERISLGLRTGRGLRLDRFQEEFGSDLRETHRPLLDDLRGSGLLVIEADSLRLTADGLALADEVALRLAGSA